MRLNGKLALVTAAGAGIGRASAIAFANEGANVIATDVDGHSLASLAGEHSHIRTELLDVTDAGAIQALAASSPALDIILYCAGYVHHGPILECSDADWSKSFDVNVTGIVRVVQAFMPAMIAKGGGSIVNVASAVSSLHAMPNRSAYGASKGAVIGLTKSIAADYVAHNIRCNAICPGPMDSPSFAQRLAATGDEKAVRAAINASLPMRRPGRLEEAAALAVYLASDEAAYTTGGVHIIDGGWKL
jgi:2-keto-3-deoxy-L-fuconate dehydrogenase